LPSNCPSLASSSQASKRSATVRCSKVRWGDEGFRLWWLKQVEGVTGHAGAHAGAGENAAVIGGVGRVWGSANLGRTETVAADKSWS